jgi:hypothetical protein
LPLPLPSSQNTLPLCLFPVHLVQKTGREKRGKTRRKNKEPNHHPFPHNKSFTPGRHRDRIFSLTHKKVFCKVTSFKTPRQKETKPSYLDTISTDPAPEGKKAAERIEDLAKKENRWDCKRHKRENSTTETQQWKQETLEREGGDGKRTEREERQRLRDRGT